MIALRKQFIFYEQGALKVSQLTTTEAVENNDVLVMVEMAEIEKADTICPRCTSKITIGELKSIFTNGNSSLMEKCLPFINDYFEKFKINTCKRKAHFFAQVRTETDLQTLTESLNYKYETLFNSDLAYYRGNEERSRRDAHDEKAIGNNAYGGRMSNRLNTDDGYNFRGRGFIMVTGRDNYSQFQKFYDSNKQRLGLPDITFASENFTNENPEKLSEEKYAVLSAVNFWVSRGLNELADGKDELQAIESIINIINSRTKSRDKRRASYIGGKYSYKDKEFSYENGSKKIFKVEECIKGKTVNLNLSGRAPWMDVAMQEAKSYGGKHESLINSRIKTYHKDGGGYNGGSSVAWCASFTNWCIKESGFSIKKSPSSQSYLSSDKVEKCEVFFGAIAVFTDCDSRGNYLSSGTGHNTFVFGKLANGKYCVLGGNQGDKLKVSDYDCSGNVFHSYADVYKKFRGFYKPLGYVIKDIDKLSEKDDYSSVGSANEAAINIKLEASQNGERSQ